MDYNKNILNCDTDKDATDFIDNMYTSSLDLTINTAAIITAASKALIGNIFYFIMILQKKFQQGTF